MKIQKIKILTTSIAGVFLTSMSAHADLFNGDGDGTSWEDPDNWLLDAVPLNNGSGNTFINVGDVVFDNDTWTALDTASNLQSATQYRVQRFLLNESTSAPIGIGSITFDFDSGGAGRSVLQTNSNSSIWGSRTGTTTANFVSGTVNSGSNTTLGARDGTGIFNITGGSFIVGRASLNLGNGTTGTGVVNISSGNLTTRAGVNIAGISTFHVEGSGAGTIGIGSEGSLDGFWSQDAGGILRTGIDAGGMTTILIDDFDDDGGGTQGNATFAAGSILDPYDLGGAVANVWHTVMTWEGTVSGAPTLSVGAVGDGWISQISGNDLQVQLVVPVPEPSVALLGGLSLLGLGMRRRRTN